MKNKLLITCIMISILLCSCNTVESEEVIEPSSTPTSSEEVSSETESSEPPPPVSSEPPPPVSSEPPPPPVSSELPPPPVSSEPPPPPPPVSSEPPPPPPVSSEPPPIEEIDVFLSDPVSSEEETEVLREPIITDSSLQAIEDDIFYQVNQLRSSLGIYPYEKNDLLKQSAYIRSEEMATNNIFSHTRPNGMEFHTAIEETGYDIAYVMENVGQAVNTNVSDYADILFDAWKASPSHYDAMINQRCTEMGIALYEIGNTVYATQHFGVN